MTENQFLAENIIDIYKKHGKACTERRGDFLWQSFIEIERAGSVKFMFSLLELGADPKKKLFVYTPLELAFRYSDGIVFYFLIILNNILLRQ